MAFFLVDLWSGLLKIEAQKSQKFGRECYQFVCVFDIMNRSGMCSTSVIYIMTQPFLLFIGKEWTNMAVPRGVWIWSTKKKKKKKESLLQNIGRTTEWSLQMEILPHFQQFQINLFLRFVSHLTLSVPRKVSCCCRPCARELAGKTDVNSPKILRWPGFLFKVHKICIILKGNWIRFLLKAIKKL